ncbi:hypothetical protein [Lyngbya aestuarii]|uniref:hypothetical protein n=1 Tax=Lyngbya aestuarii TaxID=118322 RepID=UPI00403DD6DA
MNPRKNRKSLDDALARQFIYGEQEHQTTGKAAPEEKVADELRPMPALADTVSEVNAPNTEDKPKTQRITKKTSTTSKLMDKFQTPPKEATVRFTVDLSVSMHQKLSILAAKTGKKKAQIVRVLLDETLKDVEV